MIEKKLPKSVRKHLRYEKARIRREYGSPEEQEQKIEELLGRWAYKNSNNSSVKK